MKYLFAIIVCFSASITAFGQYDSLTISILTCSPGNDLYSIYGHNAIRVNNHSNGEDLVYNYGTFDFDTPGFAYKFMRGKLPYLLSINYYSDFLTHYAHYKRSVIEQTLLIDQNTANILSQSLQTNYLPQNRSYKYDFFLDNCATRIRDQLSKNIPNLIWKDGNKKQKTWRQIIKEYQATWVWTDFGIDLIIGSYADQVCTMQQSFFIPDYLSQGLTNAYINNSPIVSSPKEVVKVTTMESSQSILFSPFYFFILLLIIEIFLLIRSRNNPTPKFINFYDQTWMITIFSGGILLLLMWFATDHIPTKTNWNCLWLSPIIPILYWNGFLHKFRVLLYISLSVLGLCALNSIPNFQILPQYFNPVVALICITIICKLWRLHVLLKRNLPMRAI